MNLEDEIERDVEINEHIEDQTHKNKFDENSMKE